MTRGRTAWSLFLLGLTACVGSPAFAGNELIIDLPGLPPVVQGDGAPPPGGAVPPPRTALPSPRASAAQYRRLADRVGQLGITEGGGATITRLPQPYLTPLARVPAGTYLVVKDRQGDWCAVLMEDGSIGWVPAVNVRLLEADVVRRNVEPQSPWLLSSAPGLGAAILREAFKYLGVRYLWGGNGQSGIDCSGLVKNCFARLGISLPRRASEQARVGVPVPFSDPAQLQPGDRLYFAVKGRRIDHTGIYVGNGYFIHSSMSRGEVGVDHLSRPLYARSLVAARRTLAGAS